jgi:hypothetical protein
MEFHCGIDDNFADFIFGHGVGWRMVSRKGSE